MSDSPTPNDPATPKHEHESANPPDDPGAASEQAPASGTRAPADPSGATGPFTGPAPAGPHSRPGPPPGWRGAPGGPQQTPPTGHPGPQPGPNHAPYTATGAPGPQPFTNRPASSGFFNSLRRSGLVRPQERWIGGVAGALAQRLGLDPILVRCLWAVLAAFSGIGLILYGLGWALLPEEGDGRIHLEQAIHGNVDVGFAAAVGTFVAGWVLVDHGLLPTWYIGMWEDSQLSTAFRSVLIVVLILLLALWLREGRRRRRARRMGATGPVPGGAWAAGPEPAPMGPGGPVPGTGAPMGSPMPPAGGPFPAGQAGPRSAPQPGWQQSAWQEGAAAAHAARPGAPAAPLRGAPAPSQGPAPAAGPMPGGPLPPATQPPMAPMGAGYPGQGAPAPAAMHGAGGPQGPAVPGGSFHPGAPQPAPLPTPRPRIPGPGRTVGLLILGTMLIALAGLAWARTSDLLDDVQTPLLAVGTAMTLLGAGVVISALRSRHGGWMSVIGTLMAILLAVPMLIVGSLFPGATGHSPYQHLLSSHTITLSDADFAAESSNAGVTIDLGEYAAGAITLDLRDLTSDHSSSKIQIEIGAGTLTILTREDQPIVLEADNGLGTVSGAVTGPWPTTGAPLDANIPAEESVPGHTLEGADVPSYKFNYTTAGREDLTLSSPRASQSGSGLTVEATVGVGIINVNEYNSELVWYGNADEAVWIVSSWIDPTTGYHEGDALPVPGMTQPAISSTTAEECIAQATADSYSEDHYWMDLSTLSPQERTSYDSCVQEKLDAQAAGPSQPGDATADPSADASASPSVPAASGTAEPTATPTN